MPTPPPLTRTKLPSGSPSSARLRRLAPSPVRVPPTPPLYTHASSSYSAERLPRASSPTPYSPKQDTSRGHHGGRPGRRAYAKMGGPATTTVTSDHDPFEYDFAPLERTALITSPMELCGAQHAVFQPVAAGSARPPSSNIPTSQSHSTPPLRITRQDSTDSNVSIPLLFDARGDFGVLAEKHRLALGGNAMWDRSARGGGGERQADVDVPEELDIEWFQSSGGLAGGLGGGLGLGKIGCEGIGRYDGGAVETGLSGSTISLDDSPKTKRSSAPQPPAAADIEGHRLSNHVDISPKAKSVVDPIDRPVRVLVKFNNDVFGTNAEPSAVEMDRSLSNAMSRSSSTLEMPGNSSVHGTSFASTFSSFSAHNPMSTRDASLAESYHTFGQRRDHFSFASVSRDGPHERFERIDEHDGAEHAAPARDTRIGSMFEDDDGWSYTLSAYGDHDDDHPLDVQLDGPAHAAPFSPEVGVPFLSPHIRQGSDSPASAPSTTHSTIFTPSYSISGLPNDPTVQQGDAVSPCPPQGVDQLDHSTMKQYRSRADMTHRNPRDVYDNSPLTTRKGLPSLPLSPKSAIFDQDIGADRQHDHQTRQAVNEPVEGLGLDLGPSVSIESDLTVSGLPVSPTTRLPASRPRARTFGDGHSSDGTTEDGPPPVPEKPTSKAERSESSGDQRGHAVDGSTESLNDVVKQALHSVPKTTIVTLMIDQEGHREILTTLRHKTIQKPQGYRDREVKALKSALLWCESPSRPEMFQQTGCIKFTAVDERNRPEWVFHHAALEHLPVLRRVTINGDEKHDYISRGATLQIRDVGVYAVYGYEDKGRVEWKFEYLVQDNTSRSTGEIKPNEKKVVPLAFYASPSFFNPDRAVKLNLLNVFKKQLIPNIVSERVKPPRIGRPPPGITMPEALPPPASGGAVSRTLDAIAKVVGKGSGNNSLVSSPLVAQSPAGSIHGSDKKNGRKRAATLFSRIRPNTPASATTTPSVPHVVVSRAAGQRGQSRSHDDGHGPTTHSPNTPSPLSSKSGYGDGRSIKPMKSLSALVHRDRDRARPSTAEAPTCSGGRKGLVPMKSLSALGAAAGRHARPRTAEPMPTMHSGQTSSREAMSLRRTPSDQSMALRASHPFVTEIARRPATSTSTSTLRATTPLSARDPNKPARTGAGSHRYNDFDKDFKVGSLDVPAARPQLGRRRPSTADAR